MAFIIQLIKSIWANYNKNIRISAYICLYLKKEIILCVTLASVSDYFHLILSLKTKFIECPGGGGADFYTSKEHIFQLEEHFSDMKDRVGGFAMQGG